VFCPDCQNALRIHGGLDKPPLAAVLQILDYVRRSMIGDAPEIANRIFIAYGHGQDWHALKELLEEWGLEVEFFNRDAVAGLLVADRWREMLNRARFAFAIMTPDDELADGRRQARQNVVHEIGLCHGRIGLQNTSLLVVRN
jgi:predicted nucleotide-binding protein